MRRLCPALLSLSFVLCPSVMRGVTIRIQDPSFSNVTTTPTSFGFSVCPTATSPGGAYLDNGQPIVADGCFGAVNESGKAITSIELTFQNTATVQRSGPNAASSDIFSNATYNAPANPTDPQGTYTFLFSGSDLAQGETFVITEDGVKNPADFPTVTLTYANVTPEPSSLWLMTTGLVGSLGWTMRRRTRA